MSRAQFAMILDPVGTLPVNDTLSTDGCDDSGSPTSGPKPVTLCVNDATRGSNAIENTRRDASVVNDGCQFQCSERSKFGWLRASSWQWRVSP